MWVVVSSVATHKTTAWAATTAVALLAVVFTGADLAAIAVAIVSGVATLITATGRLWANRPEKPTYVSELREDVNVWRDRARSAEADLRAAQLVINQYEIGVPHLHEQLADAGEDDPVFMGPE